MGDRRPGKTGGKGRKGGGDEQRRESFEAPAASRALPTAHGWSILLHPLLLEKIETLTEKAEHERAKEPDGAPGPYAKLLGHLLDLMFDKVPQAPNDPIYRGGKSLPPDWFRAKTGGGRYRLFYRFDSSTRLIVYAWVNDEHTLRTYGSGTDAYAVFRDLVADGDPPEDWARLRAAAADRTVVERAQQVATYREKHP